jgi:putative flippase GtrA
VNTLPVVSSNLRIIKERLFLFVKKKTRVIGYLIVGAVVMVLGFAVLITLVEVLHFDKVIAGVCATIFSVEVNFVLNWRINWGDRRTKFLIAWPAFHAVRVPLLFFNQALYTGLVLVGVWYIGATGITTALSIVWNYFINDKIAFRKNVKK